VTDQLQRTN